MLIRSQDKSRLISLVNGHIDYQMPVDGSVEV